MLRFFTILLLAVCFSACTGSKQSADKQYIVTGYGAVGDGQTVNTKAIQSLIDSCSTNSGGTIIIPEGTFISGALFLKQGVNLHIEKGGILKGTTNRHDYPMTDTRWEGIEKKWTSAFINAINIDGFKLTGEGMIDGSGDAWLELYPRVKREDMLQDSVLLQNDTLDRLNEWHTWGKPRLIAIQNCKNVLVSRLKLKNQACWGLFVLYTENATIENITIRAKHNIPMSDGMDIDSSDGIMITNCDIDVNDDCIAIKSGKDEDGRRVNKPSQNITVENCRFRYGHGGVSMGSEMSGGIRNVEIKNCIMEADNWAPIRFKSQPSRGGIVENITYRDLKLNNTRQAFEFNMAWRMINAKPPADTLPVVRNVKIVNVSGTVDRVGMIQGLENSPITNVVFENCNIKAKTGLELNHVEGIDLSGLAITVEEGEAVIQKQE